MSNELPNIVLLGGGTGLSTLLQGVKEYRHYLGEITVGVAVTDNGGSTAAYRQAGLVAPGDARRALKALARSHEVDDFDDLLEHSVHKVGNQWLADRILESSGDTLAAFLSANERLQTVGLVLPVTAASTQLAATLQSGRQLVGETQIPNETVNDPIVDLRLQQNVPAVELLCDKILTADLVILGPGSLYTSVIASLLPDGIIASLLETSAQKMYICNVSTERGETQGYDVAQHLRTLIRYAGPVVDCCIVNNNLLRIDSDDKQLGNVRHITTSAEAIGTIKIYQHDVVNEQKPLCHDPKKLIQAILQVAASREGLVYSNLCQNSPKSKQSAAA